MPPAALLAGGLGVLSAGSQVMQGIQQQKAANAQAGAYQAAAGEARQAAGARIGAQDFQNNALMATGTANAAAAGVNPNSGSAKVVRQNNAAEAMLQDVNARYTGNVQAASDIAAASNARLEGKQKLTGAIIGAGSTALTTGLFIKSPTSAGGLGF